MLVIMASAWYIWSTIDATDVNENSPQSYDPPLHLGHLSRRHLIVLCAKSLFTVDADEHSAELAQ